MNEGASYNKALAYSYRLLRYRPRSSKELCERLKQRKVDQAVIDKIIENFKRRRLLDDKRFARLWALNRIGDKPSSLTMIKQELAIKGIETEVIDDTLGQIKQDFDEYEIAKGLAEKKVRLLTSLNKMKAKRRLFDYLKRRGFSSDIIFKVLNEILEDDA